MNSPKIPEGLQAFLAHAESLHPSKNPRGENGFAKEFQQLKALSSQLKKDPKYGSRHGEMEHNRPKNRYKDIVPFDYNRIVLPALPGLQGSDYINGNYVKGPDGNISYLALQGPLPRTIDDFWRLICSHKCQIVIMVCKEIEMGKLKCKRYWPESEDEKLNFGGVDISLGTGRKIGTIERGPVVPKRIAEDPLSDGFVMRTLSVKSAKMEEMMVTQLQYTAWPDHDVPKSAAPLIEMNKTLRALQGNNRRPVLIHCSAGCGRTGTICAVDFAWTLLKMQKTDNFSVFDIVANLRRQRMAMVQTKEQYALVYKAVVHLVYEELENEQLKNHTYVNVDLPTSPTSPDEHSNYENCEFIKSVDRWKKSEMPNGSVHKAPLSLPLSEQDERKADSKSPSGYKAANPSQSSKEMAVTSGAEKHNDYVNLEFGSNNDISSNVAVAAAPGNKPAISAKPALPQRDSNKQIFISNPVKGGIQTSSTGQPKSPVVSDYEILHGPASGQAGLNLGKDTARDKGSASHYEIPPLVSPGDKKPTRNVPEGLLVDLADDMPPVPDKRHSIGSSRYENIGVNSSSPPGISTKRASSSPNVFDDMFLFGDRGFQPRSMQPQNTKTTPDSKAFHTVPNRLKPASGPKRCPLTTGAFDDPRAKREGGFKAVQSPADASGLYHLVGEINPPSPPKVVSPTFSEQSNLGTGAQVMKPADRAHPVHSSAPAKQGEKSKMRKPVGAYTLVGIPEAPGQMPTLGEPVPKTGPSKQKSGDPVQVLGTPGVSSEVKGKPGVIATSGVPPEVKGKPGVIAMPGVPSEVKGKPSVIATPGVPSEVKGKLVDPVEAKGKPIVESSYELVGQQWPQPGKKVSPPPQTMQPGSVQSPSSSSLKPGGSPVEVTRNTTEEVSYEVVGQQQQQPAKKVSLPSPSVQGNIHDVFVVTGQGDGESADITDIYATVGPKPSNSPNLNAKFAGSPPKMQKRTSSGSLQGRTSSSSDDLAADAPPIPTKTNEAYLAPGEEAHGSVQQSGRGTLDRFKKMIKTSSKASLTKRPSDSLPSALPRSNSAGSGVALRLDDIGYNKRVGHPKGPRACPNHWPQMGL